MACRTYWVGFDVPQSIDHSVEPDQHEDQDIPNISTEVHYSDRIGHTDRAVYLIRVRPEWNFSWNHDQTTELTVPELIFLD